MKPILLAVSLAGVTLLGLVAGTGSAAAEEKASGEVASKTAAAERVVTLKITTVYGHPQRPAAAIEVSRARMALPATTPTLAGLTKIQDSSKKDPF